MTNRAWPMGWCGIIEIDMQMKREAIERCSPPVPARTDESPWRCRKDIIQWLEDLER